MDYTSKAVEVKFIDGKEERDLLLNMKINDGSFEFPFCQMNMTRHNTPRSPVEGSEIF